MAPLPANNTDRLFVDYVTGTGTTANAHTLSVRVNPSLASPAEAQQDILDLLTAIGGPAYFRIGWTVVRTRYQSAYVDFSVPVATDSALGLFVGTNNSSGFATQRHEATQWRFDGRDTISGRRASVNLYGIAIAPPDTFRYTTTLAWVANAISALAVGSATGTFRSISGGNVTWYDYVNVQQNSYWESELRTG